MFYDVNLHLQFSHQLSQRRQFVVLFGRRFGFLKWGHDDGCIDRKITSGSSSSMSSDMMT